MFDLREREKITIIDGSLKEGQNLFDSLMENGISSEVASRIIYSAKNILDLTSLRVSDNYKAYLNSQNQVIKFIYERAPDDQYFIVLNQHGTYEAFKPVIYLTKELITKEITIESSLFEAMLKAGENESLVFKFVDIFAWDIDFFTYPRVGDKIKIYFEKYIIDDKKDKSFVKYGRILAAQYKGREVFNAIYYEPKNNQKGYYDLKGKPVEKFFLKSPLKFTGRITSYFGYRRDPFTSKHGSHSGVDFASYYGAPIVATSSGKVAFAGWKGAYGRLLIVKHSNGYSTYYGHCSGFLAKLGQSVAQGQIIAKVGSTGRSTGPHVHYEIRQRSQALNPLRFNQPKRKPLKEKDLNDFNQYLKEIWPHIENL